LKDSVAETRPLVSIVTASFNQAPFLEHAMVSVAGQTYAPVEHLVLDGGSTDGSVEILERLGGQLAYWHSRPDAGFGDAIAQGFERSKGSILGYLNSDDMLAPDALEHAVRTLRDHPDAVMVYGNRVAIDSANRLLYRRPSLPVGARSAYCAFILAQETCFWRRDVYFDVGGMNAGLRFAIDYDLFSRFAQQGRFVYSPHIWAFFRKHAQSKTMNEYRDVGAAECLRVQRERWGGEVSPWRWRARQGLVRAYALAASPFLPAARWPLPDPQPATLPLARRWLASLHETSWLKRLLSRAGIASD
jgi:glycosyltransferase involved in cell wall biosynthesis